MNEPLQSGRYSKAEPLYTEALAICQRVLGVNHPTTATIRENLAILQRQSTPRAIWIRRLGQLVQILLAIAFYNWSVNCIYVYELSSPTPTKD